MNTPFKKATNEVLEIMPILDPIEETPEDCDEIRGEGEEEQNIKVTLNEKDVFGDIIPPNDLEEEVVEKMMMEDIEEEEAEEEVVEEVLTVIMMTKELANQCSIKMVLQWIINL